MTSSNLRLLRVGCIVLAGLLVYVRYVPNNPVAGFLAALPGFRSPESIEEQRLFVVIATVVAFLPLAVLALLGAVGSLTRAIREAEEAPAKAAAERERMKLEAAERQWKHEKEKEDGTWRAEWRRPHRYPESVAAEERKRVVATARSTYPDHIDEDELEGLGWKHENFQGDPIAALLDPPEMVIKYGPPNGVEDSELRLYLRERVNRLEQHQMVKAYRECVREYQIKELQRELEWEHERKAEEQKRLMRQQERRMRQEAAERLKHQKVVRLDD